MDSVPRKSCRERITAVVNWSEARPAPEFTQDNPVLNSVSGHPPRAVFVSIQSTGDQIKRGITLFGTLD